MVPVGAICCDCIWRRRGETGCSDDALCTANICAVDPWCCDERWDLYCADQAFIACESTLFPTTPYPTTSTTPTTPYPTQHPSSSMLYYTLNIEMFLSFPSILLIFG